VKNDKDMEKLNQMDTDGVNFRHQKQKEKPKSFYEKQEEKKQSSIPRRTQVIRQMKERVLERRNPDLKFGRRGIVVETEKAFSC